MAETLEVKAHAEVTTLYNLTAGEYRDTTIVRVRYRKPPTRRWTRFFVVPQEGQTVEDLLVQERVEEVARWHADQAENGVVEVEAFNQVSHSWTSARYFADVAVEGSVSGEFAKMGVAYAWLLAEARWWADVGSTVLCRADGKRFYRFPWETDSQPWEAQLGTL
jgi:hypothetical protein